MIIIFAVFAVLLLQIFLVSGGYTIVYLDSSEIFDPDLRIWRAGAALPSPMTGLRATNIDDRVLILGIYQRLLMVM